MSTTDIVGVWSGHDTSFCHLSDGKPVAHTELERHSRIKEDSGDSLSLFFQYAVDNNIDPLSVTLVSTSAHVTNINVPMLMYGHHKCHAAHAFYSSNLSDSLVVTIDGGGLEEDGTETAMTAWIGNDRKLSYLHSIPTSVANIGGVWTRVTRYVFGLESGYPYGHQAGTVMAMAALGDASKHIDTVRTWFGENTKSVQWTPQDHVRGMSAKDPRRPRHPFLGQFEDLLKTDKQTCFDFAAALQQASEEAIVSYVIHVVKLAQEQGKIGANYNLCLSGGVSLNSLTMGRLRNYLNGVMHIYIPPVPYDAGLCIGSAQYHYHHVLNKERVNFEGSFTPFLGKEYSQNEIINAINNANDESFYVTTWSIDDVVEALDEGKVISVFNGRAESGRRALGNRSIIADPRKHNMKDVVNERVKHRQWFRPFAPSVLSEKAHHWFVGEIDSPYMSFVAHVKNDLREQVPAITHFDGTARLQTVHKETNPWYHALISAWDKKSGVPIVLDTSFNDREPIVETPKDAIACFLKTDIDVLHFSCGVTLIKQR